MSAPRFEIVRSVAGWHVRLIAANSQIVISSEVLTRRASAEKNVLAQLRALTGHDWRLHWNVVGVEQIAVRPFEIALDIHPMLVRHVDERGPA